MRKPLCSRRCSSGVWRQGTRQGSRRVCLQGSRPGSLPGLRRGSPLDLLRGGRVASLRGSPRVSLLANPLANRRASLRGIPLVSRRLSLRVFLLHNPRGSLRGSPRCSRRIPRLHRRVNRVASPAGSLHRIHRPSLCCTHRRARRRSHRLAHRRSLCATRQVLLAHLPLPGRRPPPRPLVWSFALPCLLYFCGRRCWAARQ